MQGPPTAVDRQHDRKTPQQPHQQQRIELIQAARGPAGGDRRHPPRSSPITGTPRPSCRNCSEAAEAEQNTATVLRRTAWWIGTPNGPFISGTITSPPPSPSIPAVQPAMQPVPESFSALASRSTSSVSCSGRGRTVNASTM